MLRLYQNSLKKRPHLTNMFTSGVICLGGDIVAQTYFEQKESFDFVRATRMACFGIFWWAPVTTKWMGTLERLVPGKTPAVLVKKLFIDQVLFSPFILTAFFSINECKSFTENCFSHKIVTLMNGFDSIKTKISQDLMPTVISNWSVWGPGKSFIP